MAVATKRNSSKHLQYERLLRSKLAELMEHLRDRRQVVLAERIPEDEGALASHTLLQDLAVGQVQRQQKLLGEIEAALKRVEEGEYGVCKACGDDIPLRRLEALPWARHCLKCAEFRQALSMN